MKMARIQRYLEECFVFLQSPESELKVLSLQFHGQENSTSIWFTQNLTEDEEQKKKKERDTPLRTKRGCSMESNLTG